MNRFALTIGLSILATFVAALACGGSATEEASAVATSAPATLVPATPAPATSTPATSTSASGGARLFVAKGCSACHGLSGEGTMAGPGLAGHSAAQVLRQVRAPVGLMPVFPPEAISNAKLAKIAEYVESLSGDHAHVQSGERGDVLSQHHWMTLFALEDEDQAEAVHHFNHILPQVEGSHLAQMRAARALAVDGNLHDAAHIIENMLAGTQDLDLTPSEMHLRLARSATLVEDAEGAMHHLDHFLERLSGDPVLAEAAAEIVEQLEQGDLAEAAHLMEGITGLAHEEEHNDEEVHE